MQKELTVSIVTSVELLVLFFLLVATLTILIYENREQIRPRSDLSTPLKLVKEFLSNHELRRLTYGQVLVCSSLIFAYHFLNDLYGWSISKVERILFSTLT